MITQLTPKELVGVAGGVDLLQQLQYGLYLMSGLVVLVGVVAKTGEYLLDQYKKCYDKEIGADNILCSVFRYIELPLKSTEPDL